jgi:hypothetical protein
MLEQDVTNKKRYDCVMPALKTTFNRGTSIIEETRKKAKLKCSKQSSIACYMQYLAQSIKDTAEERKTLNDYIAKHCSKSI